MSNNKFFVEYVDMGVTCSDIWTERCLLDEIRKREVEIIGIQPAPAADND